MNLLLTGSPGVGKTTIVRKVIASLTDAGLKLGGFVTDEVRERKQRIGFRVVTLDRHEVATLAQVGLDTPYRIGKYGVSPEAMTEFAIPALHRAIDHAQLIVVDEIGRMECFAPDFLCAMIDCLNSPKPVFGVLQQRRFPFLDSIRERDDVELIEVTERNRDTLALQLVQQLVAETSPAPAV